MKRWKLNTAGGLLLVVSAALFGGNIDTLKVAAPCPVPVVAPMASPALRAPAPVPIGTISVGQIAQLRFTDLTAEVARKSLLDYYPRPAGSIFFPAVGLNGDVAVFFSSPVAAKVLVWIDSPGANGSVDHAEMEITVGTPGPNPTPDPDPPGPVPPGPTPAPQKVQIVIVEETEDSDEPMKLVRNSKIIRDWAEANGHKIFFIDKDSAKTKGGAWKTWADRAVSHSTPWVFVTPVDDGATTLNGGGEGQTCPMTVASFLALAKTYGGEGVTGSRRVGVPR